MLSCMLARIVVFAAMLSGSIFVGASTAQPRVPFVPAGPDHVDQAGVFNGSWTALSPNGSYPPARRGPAVAYDPFGDRLIVVGGQGGGTLTWLLNLTGTPTWTSIPGVNVPFTSESDRAVFDPVHNEVVMISNTMQVTKLNLTNPTAWVSIPVVNSPPPRSFFATAYDPLRNRLLVFGGGPYTGLFNDVWALDLSGTPQWTQIVGAGIGPTPRWGPVAVYDSARDRLVVGTGSTTTGYIIMNDMWALSLSGTPTWSQITPTGTPPQARMLSDAIYDPGLDRVLLYGGYIPSLPAGDVWELAFTPAPAWAALVPTGTIPPPRWSLGVAYRSADPQMMLFGGWDGAAKNDTWALKAGPVSGPPVVQGVTPNGGRVGDIVSIAGYRFDGLTSVDFNGIAAPILAANFSIISTQVPVGATTGPVRVVTTNGTSLSPANFFVGELPVITSATPDSGRAGETIALHGRHFLGTTKVAIGASSLVGFTVLSDSLIEAIPDSTATTGQVQVVTPAATGASEFQFFILTDDPRPHLLSVRDARGDQGGRVVLEWSRSDFDQSRYKTITGYRVWRRAPSASAQSAVRVPDSRRMTTRVPGPNGAMIDAFWESLADLPAAYLPGYAYTAATLSDSTEDDNPYTAFFVQALALDRFAFYASSPDSGYSVDNLAPPTPMPFAVNYTGGANVLHWGASVAPDAAGFRLYRGATIGFVPGPGTLLAATRDTGYVDAPGSAYYKLACVDVHGNASHYALVSPESPTATLASLVSLEATASRIRLTWYSESNIGLVVSVERRTRTTAWSAVGTATVDGTGFVHFEDSGVAPGVEYGYRLGIVDGDAETFVGEAWGTAEAPRFALGPIRPNPAFTAPLAVEFDLATADAASLELIDVTGRRVERREVGGLGPGRHTLQMGRGSALPPGVYLVRLSQGAHAVSRRAVVLH